jgi:hypothetical protein
MKCSGVLVKSKQFVSTVSSSGALGYELLFAESRRSRLRLSIRLNGLYLMCLMPGDSFNVQFSYQLIEEVLHRYIIPAISSFDYIESSYLITPNRYIFLFL